MCEAVMCDCWATRTTTVASDDSGIYRNASKYKYKSNTGGGIGEDNLYIMRTGHHFHFVCAPTCHVALTAHSRGRARLWGGCRSSPLLLARLSCVLVPPACGSVGWVSTRFLLLQLLVLADLPPALNVQPRATDTNGCPLCALCVCPAGTEYIFEREPKRGLLGTEYI